MRINRIDDGERFDMPSRATKDIQSDAELIDLETEIFNKLPSSEDMRWSAVGRQIFDAKIDEMRK